MATPVDAESESFFVTCLGTIRYLYLATMDHGSTYSMTIFRWNISISMNIIKRAGFSQPAIRFFNQEYIYFPG